MHAIRSTHAFDGTSFRSPGATVLVEDGLIIGVEPYDFPTAAVPVPADEDVVLPYPPRWRVPIG